MHQGSTDAHVSSKGRTATQALHKLSRHQLMAICKKRGLEKYGRMRKDELVQLLVKSDNSEPHLQSENTNENNQGKIEDAFTFVDLFCGIGGFHQAMRRLGGKCVFACDIDPHCRETYETNYGIKPHGDIATVQTDDIPPFDVLCGGFPCQPFSKAGFQRGFEDERGNLFFNICAIVQTHRPKFILLENVRNLATHDNGHTWETIRQHIEQLGYYTYSEPLVLNVLHFNVPQNRERVVILCKRKDLGELPELPVLSKHPKEELTRFVGDFVESDEEDDGVLSDKMQAVYAVWEQFIHLMYTHQWDIPKFPIWTDWWDNTFEPSDPFYKKYTSWIDKNRAFYTSHQTVLEPWLTNSRQQPLWFGAVRKLEWQAGTLCEDNNSLRKCLWSARGSGIRVKKCDYIPALVAMSMTPIYGPKHRKLTSRELLKLQSFDDGFVYNENHIYKQLGNAVNVAMIEQSARFLLLGEPLT